MKAIRELVLAGTALTVSVAAIDAAYAADLPTLSTYPALSSPEALGWTMDHASAEFGGQGFIEKPGTSRENSKAKFNQYGTLTNPVFLNFFDLGAQGYDYKYTFEALGQNVGTNNQDYEVDLYQPGQQYLNLGYYSVPNLRSNTAETLYYGAGSNNLFIPPLVVQQLYGGIYNGGTPATGAGNNSTVPVLNQTLGIPPGAPAVQPLGCFLPGQTGKLACKPGVTPVQTTVLENVHRINLGIQRDAGEVDYRWTPTPNWDFQASYSDEHRYGTQEEGMLFSTGTSTPLAQVPMPVDDYTQNASILGEYYGISPWGMKWNGILRYNASIYTDTINSFAAMSPFGGPGSLASGVPNCPIATTTKVANCYGEGLMGTEPNNASNAGMAELGVDLPGFVRNRYMGTFNYNAMTQNEAFIPMTINPGPYYVGTTSPKPYSLSPLQRSSLDGEIDTMLFNNVLTTQVLPNVQNKLNYRYYSYDNNTPALTLANWIVNDSAIATNGANTATTANVGNGSYAPHTTLFSSYTKQDAAEQMTWNPVSWGTVGGSLGWEQYTYSQYAANMTNEWQGKIFATGHPTDWLSIRFNELASWRNYSNYNWQQFIGDQMLADTPGTGMVENPYLRDYNIANRNRNAGNLYFDITTPVSGLTITPNVGWRYDYYPPDPALISTGGNGLGLNSDNHWDAGIEADWAFNPSVSVTGAYTFENIQQVLVGTSTASIAPSSLTLYNSRMAENVNTWLLGTTVQIIPDRLVFKLSATYELATMNWLTSPEPGCAAINPAGTSCGIVSAGNPAYTPENTNYGHLDASLTYKLDPSYLVQFGKAEVYLQLKYMFERNNVTNWQTGNVAPYMYSSLNSSTVAFKDMIFMAGDNPNYTAQVIMASLMVKW